MLVHTPLLLQSMPQLQIITYAVTTLPQLQRFAHSLFDCSCWRPCLWQWSCRGSRRVFEITHTVCTTSRARRCSSLFMHEFSAQTVAAAVCWTRSVILSTTPSLSLSLRENGTRIGATTSFRFSPSSRVRPIGTFPFPFSPSSRVRPAVSRRSATEVLSARGTRR